MHSSTASEAFLKRRKVVGAFVKYILLAVSSLSVFVTFGIVYILLSESLVFFREVPIVEFLTDTQWAPVFSTPRFGILTLLSATLLSSFIALLVAVPCGLILAIYLSEFARPAVRETVKPILELLQGVPTVAFGYFALLVATPFFKILIPSLSTFNLLVPGIVMGVMILPFIVSLSEDAMRAIPSTMREGAYGLGFNRIQTALTVVVPGAFSGIAMSVILGMSRAVGETMVVAIAAGQNPRFVFSIPESGGIASFFDGAATITTYIVQISKGDLPHDSLAYQTIFAAGLVLFFVTLAFNILAIWLRKKFREVY